MKLRLASLQPWQALLALVAAVAAAGPGYKIIVAAATAFHRALLGGG